MAERGVSPGRSHLLKTVTALDGTRKFLLRLHDDRVVEAVGIPSEEQGKSRLTVCVSSQVGLPWACCADPHPTPAPSPCARLHHVLSEIWKALVHANMECLGLHILDVTPEYAMIPDQSSGCCLRTITSEISISEPSNVQHIQLKEQLQTGNCPLLTHERADSPACLSWMLPKLA